MIPTGGSNVNGFYFETTITLDDCESTLNYTIYVNDTSGNHNYSGPHDVAVIDNDRPQTTLEIGPPRYNNFVTTSTPIYLNTTDNCNNWYIHYRIWNENTGWSSWYVGNQNENLITTFSEEGKHYIEYYANDTSVLNNTETTHNETYYVDDTSPTTNLIIGSPKYPSSNDGCNVTSATTFYLTATDGPAGAASGVAFTWYVDNGVYHVYSGSFKLSGEGQHVIAYGSQDNLSNNESGNSITVYVDDTGPNVTMNALSDLHNSDFMVSWSGTDDGSGVTSYTIQYRENASGVWKDWLTNVSYTVTSAIWEIGNTTEGCTVYFRGLAVDNVGNCGSWSSSVSTTKDTTAPICIIEYNNSATYFKQGDKLKIYANFTEDTSGINESTVKITIKNATGTVLVNNVGMNKTDNTHWYYDYTIPSGNDGVLNVTVTAQDNATNSVTEYDESKYIDNTAPTVTIDVPTDGGYYNSLTNISGTSNDATSGVASVTITIYNATDGKYWNGTAWVDSAVQLSVTGTTSWYKDSGLPTWVDTKQYMVNATATDNAGNTGTDSNSFTYDTTAPTSQVEAISSPESIHNTPLTINATVNDATSGVKNVTLWYRNSTDNITWSPWTKYDVTLNSTPYQWNFTFPDDNSYYQFYSIAFDNAGNKETAPSGYDAWCYYNNTSPKTPNNPNPENKTMFSTGNKPSKLSWSGGDVDNDTVTYTVYLKKGSSTFDSSDIVTNTTSTSCSISVDWSSTYYWKVVATDEHVYFS